MKVKEMSCNAGSDQEGCRIVWIKIRILSSTNQREY